MNVCSCVCSSLLVACATLLACDDGASSGRADAEVSDTWSGIDALGDDTTRAPDGIDSVAPEDTAAPEDTSVADTAAPEDTSVADTAAPDDTSVADTAAPDDTSVADTAAPDDTSVADTTAPDDTSLADTAAPDDTSVADTADTTSADTSVSDTSDTTGPEVVTPPAGTPDDPIVVDHFPYVVADDTRTSGSSVLDRYDCAASNEGGPERVYRFAVAAAGTFVAEVDEEDGVDVDLNLLDADPALASDPAAVPCRARDNTKLTAELEPGTYWLVVDTYVAAAGPKPGAHRLALELVVPDAWQIVELAPGVTWSQKVYSDYAGGKQTINTIDVDLTRDGVSIRPHGGDGCIRPSRVGPAEGAVAAINAGFFDTGPGTCPPLDLIKIEGELVNGNHLTGAAQRAVGVDVDGHLITAWVAANTDWPEAFSAVGSYPSLVTDGAVLIEPDKDTDFFDGRHPRTALGVTATGHLLLVTVEGRGPAGLGMTLRQLAQHLVNLGAVDGVNLDGGGSTAMWARGQSLSGIVGYPSDGDGTSHSGERSVSDVLLVFSEP